MKDSLTDKTPAQCLMTAKEAVYHLNESQAIAILAKALSSPQRLLMLQALGKRSLNVKELSALLDLPMSTTALHVRTLEEAGLIMCEALPGERGAMKLCSRRADFVGFNLVYEDVHEGSVLTLELPVGAYSKASGIKPTCGLAGAHAAIGLYDNPESFYLPDRLDAQLIWLREGFLEYRFGATNLSQMNVQWLEVSFEACSEAPMYRNPWLSDISLLINHQPIGIWTCQADYGGRRGLLNPAWWPDVSTQFGLLKTFRVDTEGSWLENIRVSDNTLSDLNLSGSDHISVSIGVSPEAVHAGGMNLFGKGFGDFPQGIVLRIGYLL